MRHVIAAFCFATLLSAPGLAIAFGANGHQAIGAIADSLLVGTRAEHMLQKLMARKDAQGIPLPAITLEEASVWLDCARSVKRIGDPTKPSYRYETGGPEGTACATFEDDIGKAELIRYVRRHDRTCEYIAGKLLDCHRSFHFVNLPIQAPAYDHHAPGVGPASIVKAINAAIDVLNDCKPPKPFDKLTKREAVFVLAHLVGDLHQPLHVGSVYLDESGTIRTPTTPAEANAWSTRGGNSINAPGNLHSQWDGTKLPLTDDEHFEQLLAIATAVPVTGGEYPMWPVTWANDVLLKAREALQPITFKPGNSDQGWDAVFTDRRAYIRTMRKVQREQAILAGAHLAQLLQAIWPDPSTP